MVKIDLKMEHGLGKESTSLNLLWHFFGQGEGREGEPGKLKVLCFKNSRTQSIV